MRGVIRGYGKTAVYLIDGKEVTKAEFDLAFPDKPIGIPGGHHTTCWPQISEDAFAVHPKQVEQANARNRRHGINVEYDKATGAAIIPDRDQRRKLLKLEGWRDNSGGYGDDPKGA